MKKILEWVGEKRKERKRDREKEREIGGDII